MENMGGNIGDMDKDIEFTVQETVYNQGGKRSTRWGASENDEVVNISYLDTKVKYLICLLVSIENGFSKI